MEEKEGQKYVMVSSGDAPTGPADEYVFGVDLGTTSVKTSLVHSRSGLIVSPAAVSTKASVLDPSSQEEHPEGDLQDVKKIFDALWQSLEAYSSELLSRVVRIAVCGQMHGVVLWRSASAKGDGVDLEGCSSLHTWQDRRCSDDFLAALDRPESGSRIATGYGCATLLWYAKHRPEYLSLFDRAGTVMDLLTFHLCSRGDDWDAKVKMSSHNAASWGYFDVESGTWNEESLERQGVPSRLLPEVVPVGEEAGALRRDLRGVPLGTPVAVAMGDLQCAVRATLSDSETGSLDGCRPSSAVLNIGTSAQLALVTQEKAFSFPHSVELVPFSSESILGGRTALAVAASLNGGNVLAKFVDTVRCWMSDLGAGEMEEAAVWEKIIDMEEKATQPRGELMRVFPLLHGERHSPEAAASASDVTPHNLSLASTVEALCAGVASNLSDMMPRAALEAAGVSRLLATGSCVLRHPAMRRAVMAEFDYLKPEIVPEGNSCVGAALFAMDA